MASTGHWKTKALLALLALAVGTPFAGLKQVRERSAPVLAAPKERTGDDNVVLELVGEGIVKGGAVYVYPYPKTPKPQVTDSQGDDSEYSLDLILSSDAWSGAQVCLSGTTDLSPYYEQGAITMAVKGTRGGEIFSFSMMDNGLFSDGHWQQAWPPASTRSYGIVGKDQWMHLTVPLKDFGGVGSYWSDALNKRVSSPFNWKGVTCLGMDIEKNRFPSFEVFVDNIRIVKKATIERSGGEGYPFKNDGY